MNFWMVLPRSRVGKKRDSSTRWPCADSSVRGTGNAFTGGPAAFFSAAFSQTFGVSPWKRSHQPLLAVKRWPHRPPPKKMHEPEGAGVAGGVAGAGHVKPSRHFQTASGPKPSRR